MLTGPWDDGAMSTIEIDVWADVVCPWCYIGKHRLARAIAESAHPAEVSVRYHAYELDPETPVGTGTGILTHLAERYDRSTDEAREMAEQAATAGRPDGVDIRVDTQLRSNSFDAHRLIALGLMQGGPALQGAVVERLYAAHFTEGRAIDDHTELQRLGAEAGLDEGRVAAVLATEEFTDSVRADEDAARQMGITGVPFFVANRRVAVSGAQPVETFGRLLTTAFEDPAGPRPPTGGPTHV